MDLELHELRQDIFCIKTYLTAAQKAVIDSDLEMLRNLCCQSMACLFKFTYLCIDCLNLAILFGFSDVVDAILDLVKNSTYIVLLTRSIIPNDERYSLYSSKSENHLKSIEKSSVVGFNSIHLSAAVGELNIFSKLLEINQISKYVNARNKLGNTALHIAIISNSTDIVKKLLTLYPELINYQNSCGETALHLAVNTCATELIAVLCDCQFLELDKVDNNCNTALHIACSKNTEIVELILSSKILRLNSNNKNSPVLCVAAKDNINNTVKEILKYDCSCNMSSSNKTPLNVCSCKGDLHSVIYHVDSFINLTNKDFETPLIIACKNKDISSVKELLKQPNIDLNIPDIDGNTVLHIAVENNCPTIVNDLLSHSQSDIILNLTNFDLSTPLSIACKNNKSSLVKALLKQPNIDLSIPDNDGNTVLHIAVQNSKSEFVKYFISHSQSEFIVNSKNQNGNTPLHIACSANDNYLVNCLLTNKNIDLGIVNNNGEDVVRIANANCNKEMLRSFKNYKEAAKKA